MKILSVLITGLLLFSVNTFAYRIEPYYTWANSTIDGKPPYYDQNNGVYHCMLIQVTKKEDIKSNFWDVVEHTRHARREYYRLQSEYENYLDKEYRQ